MTIASEITRLQGAKSDIRQAIIDKGVDVGASLTLDGYAACINDIQQGASVNFLDILIVGGGGGGGSRSGTAGGGGGGGQVRCLKKIGTEKSSFCVVIGLGGGGNQNGGNSCICSSDGCLAYAVGGGHDTDTRVGGRSGSGCTGGGHSCAGGGGGGANGNGCNGYGQGYAGDGGAGLYGYGGGGGGNGYFNNGTGKDGGGNGDQNANGFGGGGGGNSKSGYQGMAEICYPTDGSYGFSSATGGQCCYTCNGYKVHRFTSNGTFTIVS